VCAGRTGSKVSSTTTYVYSNFCRERERERERGGGILEVARVFRVGRTGTRRRGTAHEIFLFFCSHLFQIRHPTSSAQRACMSVCCSFFIFYFKAFPVCVFFFTKNRKKGGGVSSWETAGGSPPKKKMLSTRENGQPFKK
jgi:hypothetical protein